MIAPLFFSGRHREVVERTLDAPSPVYPVEDFPYLIGALVMLGRIDEAEMTFLLREAQLTPAQKVACRFFLGIGFCRHSFYAKSFDYFLRNVRARHEAADPISRFYVYQGLGFYFFFAGRIQRALRAAEKSFAAALDAGFLYGRAFAADLKGHSLVLTGQVSHGLRTLGLAEHLANQLGASWLQEAIQASVLGFRASYGIEGNQSIERLQAKLQSLSKQDIYTQSALLLELSQIYLRCGKLNEAKDALNECCRIVHGSQNRRHAALLNLRYSYIHYLEGDAPLALNLVRNALTQIDTRVDRLLELRLRGFERKLVNLLNVEVCIKTLEEKVGTLTQRVGEAVGTRLLAREKKDSFVGFSPGEDPIGDLRDLMQRDPEASIEPILKQGYFGLLNEVLPVAKGDRALYLELLPGSLTLFDRGNVTHLNEVLTRSLRALLLELRSGPKTKEELITNIWKYEYHPIRHDALIYSAVAKLRRALGERSHWVEASDAGYQLRAGVKVVANQNVPDVLPVLPLPEHDEGTELNLRQQKILKYLKDNEAIDTSTCRTLFETSEITASRDLTELMKLNLIQRIGKGRATKYTRRSSL